MAGCEAASLLAVSDWYPERRPARGTTGQEGGSFTPLCLGLSWEWARTVSLWLEWFPQQRASSLHLHQASSCWAHQKWQRTSYSSSEACFMRGLLRSFSKRTTDLKVSSVPLQHQSFLGTKQRGTQLQDEFRAACYSCDHCNFPVHQLRNQFILGKLWLRSGRE